MAHLTLQEVIDRVNHNHSYYAESQLRSDRKPVSSRPHYPEYYVPRITRLVAGLLFGAFHSSGSIATAQRASGRYPAPPPKLLPLVAEET